MQTRKLHTHRKCPTNNHQRPPEQRAVSYSRKTQSILTVTVCPPLELQKAPKRCWKTSQRLRHIPMRVQRACTQCSAEEKKLPASNNPNHFCNGHVIRRMGETHTTSHSGSGTKACDTRTCPRLC